MNSKIENLMGEISALKKINNILDKKLKGIKK